MGRTFGTLKDFSERMTPERMKNEVTPERMMRWIPSENKIQVCLAMEITSDAVKNNIAQEPKC